MGGERERGGIWVELWINRVREREKEGWRERGCDGKRDRGVGEGKIERRGEGERESQRG